jgi:hypothetical protein
MICSDTFIFLADAFTGKMEREQFIQDIVLIAQKACLLSDYPHEDRILTFTCLNIIKNVGEYDASVLILFHSLLTNKHIYKMFVSSMSDEEVKHVNLFLSTGVKYINTCIKGQLIHSVEHTKLINWWDLRLMFSSLWKSPQSTPIMYSTRNFK